MPEIYRTLKEELIRTGYGDEIQWAETVGPCTDALTFFREFTWVVLNSGMRNQIARRIAGRVYAAIRQGIPVKEVFGHPGKAAAIQKLYEERTRFFEEYRAAEDKLEYLRGLPWIGPVTKYHLAKNLGMDVCKPDRHLVRIAGIYGMEPKELCERLSEQTGDRIGVVDLVLWRSANLGIIRERV